MRTIAAIAAALTLVGPASTQKTCGGRVKLTNIWKQLCKLHDKDQDGRITAAEFTRGDKQFANHDRDRDGVITAADFPAGRFWNGFGPGIARAADRDRDRTVTGKEWAAFVSGLDVDGDGILTGAEFRRMTGPVVAARPDLLALSFDQDGDGKIEVADFEALFLDLDTNDNGKLDPAELRGNRSLLTRPTQAAPRVGQPAPDFDLPRLVEGPAAGTGSAAVGASVRLSAFRGQRPVALIFGSYT